MDETPDWVPPSASPPSWPPPPASPPPPSAPSPASAWGGWPGVVPRAAYKPGVVPLRPLSVGEILDGGFATVRRNPKVVFGFAFVLAVLVQLVRLLLGWAFSDVGATISTSLLPRSSDGSRPVITSGGVSAFVLSFVIGQIFTALLAGVVTNVVGKAVLGQRTDGRATLVAVGRRWWPLLIVSVLAGALPYAPALFLIAGPFGIIPMIGLGVYLWGKLALAVPAFVLERIGVGRSIGRSWRLVRGAFWRTWGLRALATLIVGIAGAVLEVPFGLSSFTALTKDHPPSTGALALATIGTGVVWMLTQPLFAAVLTLIYVDRRMRAEGLDIQLAQTARTGAAAAAPGVPNQPL